MTAAPDDRFVSTGVLPPQTVVRSILDEADEHGRAAVGGRPSAVYPALARVSADHLGLCVVDIHGAALAMGDADVEFALMSVAKPFVFALVCDLLGPEQAGAEVGVDPTGLPFDSLAAIEREASGSTNPMVSVGRVDAPTEVLDLYTRQSCLRATARDLAVMGATLADGGGIVTVSPGKGGLGTFAPPLDAAGNTVRGHAIARLLSRRLGLDLFASAPAAPPTPPDGPLVR